MNWIRRSRLSPRLAAAAVLFAVAGAQAASAEGKSDSPARPPTQSDVLVALDRGAVMPGLAHVAQTAAGLAGAARAFCDAPDPGGLERTQAAWHEAYLAQRRAEPLLFAPSGKAMRQLQAWPAYEPVLRAAKPGDFAKIDMTAHLRGYAAAEYLLFDLFAEPGVAPETMAPEIMAGRCAHLVSVTDEIAERSEAARKDWAQGSGRAFVAAGDGAGDGAPFLQPRDALAQAFASLLDLTETLLRDRIGIPGGVLGQPPRPDHLEARHSGDGWKAFAATAEGLHLALVGDGTSSFTGLIASQDGLISRRDPALAQAIVAQIETIRQTADKGSEAALDGARAQGRLEDLYHQFADLQELLVQASLVLELDFSLPSAQFDEVSP